MAAAAHPVGAADGLPPGVRDGLLAGSAGGLLQGAAKRAFHCKRLTVIPSDLPTTYGHGGAGLPQLLDVPDAEGLLARAEGLVDTSQAPPLPKAPMEASVQPHWLAVDGIQPTTTENAPARRTAAVHGTTSRQAAPAGSVPPPAATAAPIPATPADGRGDGESGSLAVGLPLRHSLPDELQLYFDMVRRTLQASSTGSAQAGHAVATSLATDPGLQPMLPYLVPLLAQEVGCNLGNVQHLRLLFSAVRGLLSNPHLQMAPYIHHLLPAILTCLVARGVGTTATGWSMREEAAALLGQVAQRSQEHNDELAAALARVQKSLAAALLDDASETQFGSLVGLMAFGVPVVLSTIVPKIQKYSGQLEVDCPTVGQLQVRAALLVALGRCMTWDDGSEAPAILRAVQGTWLADVLVNHSFPQFSPIL